MELSNLFKSGDGDIMCGPHVEYAMVLGQSSQKQSGKMGPGPDSGDLNLQICDQFS